MTKFKSPFSKQTACYGLVALTVALTGREIVAAPQTAPAPQADWSESQGASRAVRETVREKSLNGAKCDWIPRLENEPPRAARSGKQAQSIPLFNSRPGAKAQIYLDFDGEVVDDERWGHIVAPAYNLSSAEIGQIFERVKEDFAPFDVNITTDVAKFNQATLRVRCIITPNDAASPGAGGVAYTGLYPSTTPSWVFNSSVLGIAEAISHEVGHTLGLNHDGQLVGGKLTEYYGGHSTPGGVGWASIMGVGYYQPLTQWSRGEYAGANNFQDDLAVIASNGFGLVADEVGNSRGAATALSYKSPAEVSARGLINSDADVDYFAFSTSGGLVTLNALGAAPASNLDIALELEDASGKLIATARPNEKTDASLSLTLTPGLYFLKVQGVGLPQPPATGYSGYASIGAYSLAGSVPGGARNSAQTVLLAPAENASVSGAVAVRAKTTGSARVNQMQFAVRALPNTVSRTPNLTIKPKSIASDALDILSFAPFGTASVSFDLNLPYNDNRTKITLIAPDGNRVVLRDAPDAAFSLRQTIDVSNALRGKSRGGRWRLEVALSGINATDNARLNSWTLNFATENWTSLETDSNGVSSAGEWTSLWNTASLLSGKYEVRATPLVSASDGGVSDTNSNITVAGAAPPVVSVQDMAISETNAARIAAFTLTLSAPSATPVSLRYYTGNVIPALKFNALAGQDFTALPATRVTFAPGETRKVINVTILGDVLDEEDEKFALILDNGSNVRIPDSLAVATIIDDDSAPSLSVASTPATEGKPGAAVLFQLNLARPSGRAVTVNCQTFAASAPTASANLDYQALPLTSVVFEPGQISKSVAVKVNDDVLDEPDERVGLRLSLPLNVAIPVKDFAGLILDNDALPSLSSSDLISLREGSQNFVTGRFNIRLSAPSGRAVRVNFATALLPNQAVSPADFEAKIPTALLFNPGETGKVVEVKIRGDLLNENDESFAVKLSSPLNASIQTNSAQGLIVNDDSEPSLSLSSVSSPEGNQGRQAIFTVTLSAPSGQNVSVEYRTRSGSATSEVDFGSASGTLVFEPGQTAKTFAVWINGDTDVEPDEVFGVELLNAQGASLGVSQATGTLLNDDSNPELPAAFSSHVSPSAGKS